VVLKVLRVLEVVLGVLVLGVLGVLRVLGAEGATIECCMDRNNYDAPAHRHIDRLILPCESQPNQSARSLPLGRACRRNIRN
jgi:hypothetical protein